MNKKLLETIRCVDGEALNLEYHQRRYENSLKALGQKANYNLKEQLSPPKEGVFRCRIIYDESVLEINYYPYEFAPVNSLKVIYDDTIEYSLKYADRARIDELFSQRTDCDDIVIVKSGFITDTSKANLAFFDGKEWLTPRHALLQGTTKMRYVEEKKLIEKEIRLNDIGSFEKIAVLNAMVDFSIVKNGIIL